MQEVLTNMLQMDGGGRVNLLTVWTALGSTLRGSATCGPRLCQQARARLAPSTMSVDTV